MPVDLGVVLVCEREGVQRVVDTRGREGAGFGRVVVELGEVEAA